MTRARMPPSLACVIAVFVAGSSLGCGAPVPAEKPPIRVSYSAQPDMDDIPSFLAHAALRAKGYKVEEVFFALSELGVEALMRRNIEFATGSFRGFWAAAGRGAHIRAVMEHSSNGHRLVVRKHITTCKGLDGQHVAIQSESAAGTALLRDYFAEECPEVRLQTLFIPQSQNRAAALLSGQLDAAVLELSLFLDLRAA